jgi:hypothetical protein
MELKTARLTLLIDPNKKTAFERLCALQDRTASQVVRQLIRDYLAEHAMDDIAPGAEAPPDVSPETKRSAPTPHKAVLAGQKTDKKASKPATRSGLRRR